MIDLNWRPKLNKDGKLPFPDDPDGEPVEILSPAADQTAKPTSKLKRRRTKPTQRH